MSTVPISTSPSSLQCGYLLVRKPEWNFDPVSWPTAPREAPKLNTRYYSGVDRMPWHDPHDLKMNGHLSIAGEEALECVDATATRRYLPWLDITQSFESAMVLLNECERHSDRNELIGLFSPQFAARVGTVTTPRPTTCLGYDIVRFCEFSILLAGCFAAPSYFSHWLPLLNEHGLLSSIPDCAQYELDYARAVLAGAAEDYDPELDHSFTDWVRVDRVL